MSADDILIVKLEDMNGDAASTLKRAMERHIDECDKEECFVCSYIRNASY